jgi:hypothetical protein
MRTAAAVLLATILAPPLWWSIQLLGLPDIGEPFDVAAFRALRIPDDSNAFILYRQAAERLVPLIKPREPKGQSIDQRAPWSKAAPAVRQWVERNREAMELFRRGADRPDALNSAGASGHVRTYELWSAFVSFKDLALLEASQLEDQGDLGGAWAWYRAALRVTCHVGLRGTTFERRFAQNWNGEILRRLEAWAADPRTDAATLRRALDDVLALGLLTPVESYTLKADLQILENDLTNRHNPGRWRLLNRLRKVTVGSADYQLDSDTVGAIADAWRFWRREPERSRRVIRLAFANWLAYYDVPADRRGGPDLDVSGPFDFYQFGADAPAQARALSPRALDRWLRSTSDAQILLSGWDVRSIRIRERANYRALVVLMASQLYRRDHGTDPPSEAALVGPYLKELPDDGLGETGRASNREGVQE